MAAPTTASSSSFSAAAFVQAAAVKRERDDRGKSPDKDETPTPSQRPSIEWRSYVHYPSGKKPVYPGIDTDAKIAFAAVHRFASSIKSDGPAGLEAGLGHYSRGREDVLYEQSGKAQTSTCTRVITLSKLKTKKPVVIKIVENSALVAEEFENYSKAADNGIAPPAFGSCYSAAHRIGFLVMQKAEMDGLDFIRHIHKDHSHSWDDKLDMLLRMNFLVSRQLHFVKKTFKKLYFDIKPDNIVCANNTFYLIDFERLGESNFGTSRWREPDRTPSKSTHIHSWHISLLLLASVFNGYPIPHAEYFNSQRKLDGEIRRIKKPSHLSEEKFRLLLRTVRNGLKVRREERCTLEDFCTIMLRNLSSRKLASTLSEEGLIKKIDRDDIIAAIEEREAAHSAASSSSSSSSSSAASSAAVSDKTESYMPGCVAF